MLIEGAVAFQSQRLVELDQPSTLVHCRAIEAAVYQHTQLVLNLLRDTQPMQVNQKWRDVVKLPCADCETCTGITDNLKVVKVALRKTCQHNIAEVHLDR